MILVTGAGGFIGGHLVARLLEDGEEVRAVDLKPPEHWHQFHDDAENRQADLRHPTNCGESVAGCRAIYNLAADMGGIGFIESHKAATMLSVLINTNLLEMARLNSVERFFFASSACVYPARRQGTAYEPALAESDAYPADPEDGYGWEKLFSERMCRHYHEDHGLEVRVGRFHNSYGPMGTWRGGREKAPAAICRKVAEAKLGMADGIEIWGNGEQTRSFMFVEDNVEGILRLMDSDYTEPLNIGSAELVSIDTLVDMVERVAGVGRGTPRAYDLSAPQGVKGRNSDNMLVRAILRWAPETLLVDGLKRTYPWIEAQVEASHDPT